MERGQTSGAHMKAKHEYLKTILKEIEDAKIRREEGTALSSDNELINSETVTRDKIRVFEESILPLRKVLTQRPASEDDRKVLVGLILLGKLLGMSSPAKIVYKNEQKEPSDKEDKFRDTRKFLRVHDGDTRTHTQALADLLSHFDEITNSKSHSHKEVYEVVDKMRNGKWFGAPAEFEVRTRKLKKGWYGGTLNQFLHTEFPLSGFVTKLTCRIKEKEHSAYRLTEEGSNIIRGIMKKVEQLHRNGVSHGDLNSNNIILDCKYSVEFVKCKYVKDENGMQSDWKSLSEIIEKILKGYREDAIPYDVKRLIYLLKNYCRENRDIVFNHSSLWTPMETVANTIVIRSAMGASPDTEEVWNNANSIEEQKEDWTVDICKDDSYCRSLNTWIEKLGKNQSSISDLNILSWFRVCFNHPPQFQQQNLGNKDEKTKLRKKKKKNSRPNKHQALLQIEEELYVMFPKYMADFLECNRTQKLITSVYRTEC